MIKFADRRDQPKGSEIRGFMALKSLDTKGLVVYPGTFSKILVPGLRRRSDSGEV